jgi:internalin A
MRDRLAVHLKQLERQGLIEPWHDRCILPGADQGTDIDRRLSTADIILLLVSADFIASDYCWGTEMKRALERHEMGQAVVVPVVLRPCEWSGTPFAKLSALPRDARPVSHWTDPDDAWVDVARGIRRLIEDKSPEG